MFILGTPPKSRHGHLVVVDPTRKCIIVHGGMAGSNFYDDLHILEVNDDWSELTWKHIPNKRAQPNPGYRAAHAGAISGDHLYIFGGMNKDGSLDNTWKLNLGIHIHYTVRVKDFEGWIIIGL